MSTDVNELARRLEAMQTDAEKRAEKLRAQAEAEILKRVTEPRAPATSDGQWFSPMAELAKWRRWARKLLGDDGFVGDEEQRARIAGLALATADPRLGRITKAATAFVDAQGVRVSIERGHTIARAEDFASEQWPELVAAVEAGR